MIRLEKEKMIKVVCSVEEDKKGIYSGSIKENGFIVSAINNETAAQICEWAAKHGFYINKL